MIDLTDLTEQIRRWDEGKLPLQMETLIEAARRYANPDIEAAMEAYETHQPTTREWIAEAVAAALTGNTE